MIELNTNNQEEKRKCSKCGKELMAWETVCPECGYRNEVNEEDHMKDTEEPEYRKPDYRTE